MYLGTLDENEKSYQSVFYSTFYINFKNSNSIIIFDLKTSPHLPEGLFKQIIRLGLDWVAHSSHFQIFPNIYCALALSSKHGK